MKRTYNVAVRSKQKNSGKVVQVTVEGARVAAEKAARVLSGFPDPHVTGLRRV